MCIYIYLQKRKKKKKSGHLLPSPFIPTPQLDLFPFFFFFSSFLLGLGMEEEKKNVLCVLLLTDGVCLYGREGSRKDKKKKKFT